MARRIMDSTNQLFTADLVDPNELWTAYQDSLEDYNQTSNGLVSLLAYRTTEKTYSVLQGAYEFEDYADFTLPDSQDLSYLEISIGMKDHDLRYAFTWARIIESSQQELDARHAAALQADQRLQLRQVLRAALTKEGVVLGGVTSPAFYNGDGTIPPTVKNTVFTGSHNHYLKTTAATLAASDLDRMEADLTHHGFTQRLILLINRQETPTIEGFTRFVPNSATNTDANLINLPGDPYIGAYRRFSILEEDWIPPGYLLALSAQGGANSPQNPVAVRESQNPAAQGLILQRGTNPEYPLSNSFYYRKMGAGVRQRGNGVAMQVTAGGSYTSPVI